MKVQVLQHVSFEGLGSINRWLSARGATVRFTRFFESWDLPEPAAVDMVVALGGPMSVNDEREYPWLRREKEFVEGAIRRGLPVVGVCLGAQIIASALGEAVFRNPQKEIGWFPIEGVAGVAGVDGGTGAFRFPAEATVFHWHGETFNLPPGAAHLARSAACEHQAFQVGRRVVGLQFHLETTPEAVEAMVAHCGGGLVEETYVQSASQMRSATESAYAAVNRLMDGVLAYVTG